MVRGDRSVAAVQQRASNKSALHGNIVVQSIPRVDDNDSYYSNSNSEDGSYWDWREEDANQNTPTASGPQRLTMPVEAAEDEAGASSGYDCMKTCISF